MSDEVFRVVFVCTGNRCRSPYAARLLARVTEGKPVIVESVGTLDSPGQKSPDELIAVAQSGGLDLSSHGAVPMLPSTLAGADLVIGFSFDHVSNAVVRGGASRSVTFLLPELSRLLREIHEVGGDGDRKHFYVRAKTLISAANEHRQAETSTLIEEVADPFGGRRRAYEEMAQEVDHHVAILAHLLFDCGPAA